MDALTQPVCVMCVLCLSVCSFCLLFVWEAHLLSIDCLIDLLIESKLVLLNLSTASSAGVFRLGDVLAWTEFLALLILLSFNCANATKYICSHAFERLIDVVRVLRGCLNELHIQTLRCESKADM